MARPGTSSIGLFEAKTHFSELVARAEQGEEVVITRHNKPVARIVPMGAAPGFDLQRRQRALANIDRLRDQITLRGGPVTHEEIREWIRKGRK